ncbi:MAG: glycosyltransferase family 2 protein [Vitreimonas sp.]
MKFSVLIPTHANGAVIRNAIESVLSQTVGDFELFIVGDGAPAQTHAIMDEFVARDRRVRAFKFDKGARHGEAHRHIALSEADADAVCYLSDDDFWFPDHLAAMRALLKSSDLAHTRQVDVLPWCAVSGHARHLGEVETRERMAHERFNCFGITVAGHRLDAYRRLAIGWSPAPADIWTDLHMWRKLLAAEDVRFGASPQVTALHFPRTIRNEQATSACYDEVTYWHGVFREPAMREALRSMLPADAAPLPLFQVAAKARELRAQAQR